MQKDENVKEKLQNAVSIYESMKDRQHKIMKRCFNLVQFALLKY